MTELSTPLAAPEKWVIVDRTTGNKVIVSAKTWFEARDRAMRALNEMQGSAFADSLDCIYNPTAPGADGGAMSEFEALADLTARGLAEARRQKDEWIIAEKKELDGVRNLARLSSELVAAYDNLKAVQARCTELMLENRALREALAEQ